MASTLASVSSASSLTVSVWIAGATGLRDLDPGRDNLSDPFVTVLVPTTPETESMAVELMHPQPSTDGAGDKNENQENQAPQNNNRQLKYLVHRNDPEGTRVCQHAVPVIDGLTEIFRTPTIDDNLNPTWTQEQACVRGAIRIPRWRSANKKENEEEAATTNPAEDDDEKEMARQRLLRFCQKYCPENIEHMDTALEDNKGNFEEMFAGLVSMFGPEPEPEETLEPDVAATADQVDQSNLEEEIDTFVVEFELFDEDPKRVEALGYVPVDLAPLLKVFFSSSPSSQQTDVTTGSALTIVGEDDPARKLLGEQTFTIQRRDRDRTRGEEGKLFGELKVVIEIDGFLFNAETGVLSSAPVTVKEEEDEEERSTHDNSAAAEAEIKGSSSIEHEEGAERQNDDTEQEKRNDQEQEKGTKETDGVVMDDENNTIPSSAKEETANIARDIEQKEEDDENNVQEEENQEEAVIETVPIADDSASASYSTHNVPVGADNVSGGSKKTGYNSAAMEVASDAAEGRNFDHDRDGQRERDLFSLLNSAKEEDYDKIILNAAAHDENNYTVSEATDYDSNTVSSSSSVKHPPQQQQQQQQHRQTEQIDKVEEFLKAKQAERAEHDRFEEESRQALLEEIEEELIPALMDDVDLEYEVLLSEQKIAMGMITRQIQNSLAQIPPLAKLPYREYVNHGVKQKKLKRLERERTIQQLELDLQHSSVRRAERVLEHAKSLVSLDQVVAGGDGTSVSASNASAIVGGGGIAAAPPPSNAISISDFLNRSVRKQQKVERGEKGDTGGTLYAAHMKKISSGGGGGEFSSSSPNSRTFVVPTSTSTSTSMSTPAPLSSSSAEWPKQEELLRSSFPPTGNIREQLETTEGETLDVLNELAENEKRRLEKTRAMRRNRQLFLDESPPFAADPTELVVRGVVVAPRLPETSLETPPPTRLVVGAHRAAAGSPLSSSTGQQQRTKKQNHEDAVAKRLDIREHRTLEAEKRLAEIRTRNTIPFYRGEGGPGPDRGGEGGGKKIVVGGGGGSLRAPSYRHHMSDYSSHSNRDDFRRTSLSPLSVSNAADRGDTPTTVTANASTYIDFASAQRQRYKEHTMARREEGKPPFQMYDFASSPPSSSSGR